MTQLAVVQIEGVLAKVNLSIKSARPTNDALKLWSMIKSNYNTAIVTAAGNRVDAAGWLHRHAIDGYDRLDADDHSIKARPESLWLSDDIIASYRAMGWDVGPYITSDPVVAARCLLLGVPTWFIAHPLYLRPQHRPDAPREARPWAAMVDEVERQKVMKQNDLRLEAEDVIGGWTHVEELDGDDEQPEAGAPAQDDPARGSRHEGAG